MAFRLTQHFIKQSLVFRSNFLIRTPDYYFGSGMIDDLINADSDKAVNAIIESNNVRRKHRLVEQEGR